MEEVFQCILMGKDGQSRKYVAITGKTDCVSASDIEECLPQKEIDIRRDSTSQVILVHNHPDCYRDTRIFEKRSGDVVGFVSNGSLSTLDVGLANSLYTRFRGKVPITMKAINERGLTHSYSGGQSQRYFE